VTKHDPAGTAGIGDEFTSRPLSTNHIGVDRGEYTDAIWVYWSKDPNRRDPKNKAVVLDGHNCTWSEET
jgi:hypothetical protein